MLIVQPGIGVEGYRIDEEAGALQVTGNDPRGLLYGVGRLLHDGSFGPAGFTPGAWRGASAPDCSLRGMYLAHNFRNWWRSAPIGDTVRYLEELALWGLNTIIVPPGTNPPSPPDEVYGTLIPKQVELLKAARRLGIHVGMSAASYKNRRSLRSKYFRIVNARSLNMPQANQLLIGRASRDITPDRLARMAELRLTDGGRFCLELTYLDRKPRFSQRDQILDPVGTLLFYPGEIACYLRNQACAGGA